MASLPIQITFELLPIVIVILQVTLGVAVAVLVYGSARKAHKQLMRSIIADCIEQNSDYEKFASMDALFERVIEAQRLRKNLPYSFVEGAYLLFLREPYARERMTAIHAACHLSEGPFVETVGAWAERGKTTGRNRVTERINAYSVLWKRILLRALKPRIERFRLKSIEGFSSIFLSVSNYAQESVGESASSRLVAT